MAAGLGFKDFTTGEVLTAADVDGYLMQGVWVFASAAARDAAVTSPQEGNFAYLKDTNVTTYYTGSAWANLDTTGMTNPMTTTGDTIYSSSGSTPARLGIGSTGNVLTVAGGVPTWAAPAGGSLVGCQAYVTSGSQSVPDTTDVAVNLGSELFDTDGFHDTSTNTSRFTIPSGKAGKYNLTAAVFVSSGITYRSMAVFVNGSAVNSYGLVSGQFQIMNDNGVITSGSAVLSLSVGDYVQVIIQVFGGSRTIPGANVSLIYLGA